MAKTIGRLNVMLGVNSARFSSGLAGASKRVGGFSRSLGGLKSVVAGVGATLVAAFGARAIFRGITSAAADLDKLAKTARRVGITSESLAGLRHAADQTGAGADKMDAAITTMTKRLGEAAMGSGEARDSIEALGLSATSLAAMRPDEAFAKISDAMAAIESPTKRAAIASDLFSRGNMQVINTLMLGSKGLKEMAVEAKRLGLAFTEVDMQKVEAANDAIDSMRKALRGGFLKAIVELAPMIEDIARGFQNWIVNEGGVQSIAAAMEGVMKAAVGIGKAMEKVIGLSGDIKVPKAADIAGAMQRAPAEGMEELIELFETRKEELRKARQQLTVAEQDLRNEEGLRTSAHYEIFQGIRGIDSLGNAQARVETLENVVHSLTMTVQDSEEVLGEYADRHEALAGVSSRAWLSVADDVDMAGSRIRATLQAAFSQIEIPQIDMPTLEDFGKNAEAAMDLWDDLSTPMEKQKDKIAKQVAEIKRLQELGPLRGGITKQSADQLRERLKLTLDGEIKLGGDGASELGLASAMARYSQEASNTIALWAAGGRSESPVVEAVQQLSDIDQAAHDQMVLMREGIDRIVNVVERQGPEALGIEELGDG